MFLFLFFITLLSTIQCYLLNISIAIINTQTVISCGLSIDIYSSFDPAQVVICPYVFIDKDKIQLFNISICKIVDILYLIIKRCCFFIDFDNNNQIIIQSNPPLISPPKFSIKLDNNSFISPLNINQNSTYYLSFSPELTCRVSLLNNATICFYYPVLANFIHIEHHYDEIEHGSLILPEKTRIYFYIIFIIIGILIVIMSFFAIYIICTSQVSLRHTTQINEIINSQMTKQEAAKQSTDLPQDGGVGQPPILAEHLTVRDPHVNVGDA